MSTFSSYIARSTVPTETDDLGNYVPAFAGLGATFVWCALSDGEYQECVQKARDELAQAGHPITNANCVSHAEDLETRVQWQLLWRAMRDPKRRGDSLADPYPRRLAKSVEELARNLPTRARVELVQRYLDWTRDLLPDSVRSLSDDELREIQARLRNPETARQLSPAELRNFAISVADRIA